MKIKIKLEVFCILRFFKSDIGNISATKWEQFKASPTKQQWVWWLCCSKHNVVGHFGGKLILVVQGGTTGNHLKEWLKNQKCPNYFTEPVFLNVFTIIYIYIYIYVSVYPLYALSFALKRTWHSKYHPRAACGELELKTPITVVAPPLWMAKICTSSPEKIKGVLGLLDTQYYLGKQVSNLDIPSFLKSNF